MTDIWLTPPTQPSRGRGFRRIRTRSEPSPSNASHQTGVDRPSPAAKRRSRVQQSGRRMVPWLRPVLRLPLTRAIRIPCQPERERHRLENTAKLRRTGPLVRAPREGLRQIVPGRLQPPDQISICVPSSTTRLGGMLKKSMALVALRDIQAKICSRHIAMPGLLEGMTVSRLRK